MIERLRDSSGFGLKVSGSVTADDIKAIEPQIQREIADSRKKPVGILIDLTGLQSMEWRARWEELRFLAKFGGPIARVAVIGARKWESWKEMWWAQRC
jgi:SpoIIAA-like